MAKKGSSQPIPQVDPGALVQQQAQQNRINQFGPTGNLIYGKTDSAGKFVPSTGDQASAYIEESPFQQRYREGGEDLALTAQTLAAPRIANLPAAPIDTTQLPGFKSGIDWSRVDKVPSSADFSADATRVEQATFDRARGLLAPEFEKRYRSLETNLANRGLPMGGEAYSGAVKEFRDAESEAYNRAALDAVAAGRAEQSRLFGQALSGHQAGLGDQTTEAGLTNAARAQQVQEQQALRSANLQEIGAMLGLNAVQPVEAKGFFQPSPIDVSGPYQLSQNAALANVNQANQQQNSFLQGLFGLGSAAAGALIRSDERSKENIEPVGETFDGEPLFKFAYKDDPAKATHIGVMAQNLAKTKPEAVHNIGGMLHVDYSRVT